ncbi:MAG: prolyl oligopeptidase family serine peptidase [Weeksellaceae bacterium]|nr:prolyl oligopeptidase family serine peptidase [Weeksellaceae bacterium]
MKQPTIKLLLLHLLLLSAILDAQDRHENELAGIIARTEIPGHLKGAPGGRWVAWRKTYDTRNDTLRIQNTLKPARFFHRLHIRDYGFMRGDELWLLGKDGQAEWLNMDTGKAVRYSGVAAVQYLSARDLLLLHHTPDAGNRMVILDRKGRPVCTVEDVVRFTVTPEDTVLAVTGPKGGPYRVVKTAGTGPVQEVFRTDKEVTTTLSPAGAQGVLAIVADAGTRDAVFVESATGKVHRLSALVPGPFKSVVPELPAGGEGFLLKLISSAPPKQTELPDIWYGSDRNLQQKFYPDRTQTVIWHPARNTVDDFGGYRFSRSFGVNSGRYFLSFDETALQDYTELYPPLKMYRYDAVTGSHAVMDTISRELFADPNGKWLLAPVAGRIPVADYRDPKVARWHLYETAGGRKTVLNSAGLGAPYFTGSGTILFDGDGGIRSYLPAQNKLQMMAPFEGCRVKILNGTATALLQPFRFFTPAVNEDQPLLLEVTEKETGRVMFALRHRGITTVIVPFTADRITHFTPDAGLERFTWIRENHNKPPAVETATRSGKVRLLYASNANRRQEAALHLELTTYKGISGGNLKGLLYRPAHYEAGKKYPVVVHIYENQSRYANRFIAPTLKEFVGFNIRTLTEKGYFVYLPDIDYGEAGPGLSALHCVNRAVDALLENPAVDAGRIALIGQSFGGYETNFIATRSGRFATYISGNAPADLVHNYHAFSYNYFKPGFWRYETQQFRMGVSFAAGKQKYIANSPLHHAEKVQSPMLLWTGLEDRNVDWEETRTFYNALKRNDKKVIALFYKNNGHGMQHEDAMMDLSKRILDWLDYFLKGIPAEWIGKEMESRPVAHLTPDAAPESPAWIRENHNLPPAVETVTRSGRVRVPQAGNAHLRQEVALHLELTAYKGVSGGNLKGLLYRPAHYETGKKYPAVVHIYEDQSRFANRFIAPTLKEPLGFNIRTLTEKGYFVYLPDIDYGDEGPGLSALHCVNRAMDALLEHPGVDARRMALIGQSFGGYETNFIATRSNRFVAYISGTAHADLVHTYHSFNYNYLKPTFWRHETQQVRMGVPFAANKQKYIANSPLYHAEKIQAPMLLWTGLEDRNVDWEDTRSFYNALRRNDKKVIALFYKNNGHGMEHEDAMMDLSKRILDWLDYFLKGIPSEWIGKEMEQDSGPEVLTGGPRIKMQILDSTTL